MEATKKGSFFQGKPAKSFSRVTKPRATSHQQCGSSGSSKVVPCSPSISNGSSISRVSSYSYACSTQPTSLHKQKSVANLPSSMQKVSYDSFKPPSSYDHHGYANDVWDRGDENVDFRATIFISNVRERFKHDSDDSTGNKYRK